MDSKEKEQNKVELALKALHQQIDSLKEKVEELCESTGCWGVIPGDSKSSKKDKK